MWISSLFTYSAVCLPPTPANHRSFYWLVVVVSLCGLVMLGVLLYRFFKLDLVLFYRSHCPRLHQRSGECVSE